MDKDEFVKSQCNGSSCCGGSVCFLFGMAPKSGEDDQTMGQKFEPTLCATKFGQSKIPERKNFAFIMAIFDENVFNTAKEGLSSRAGGYFYGTVDCLQTKDSPLFCQKKEQVVPFFNFHALYHA